jgi:Sugar phosphate isomerases/epimerases
MTRPKLGLIGIIHEEAKRDFWGTMERVAAIGYEGIEGGAKLLEDDAKANVARFRSLGLEVATHSVNRDQLADAKELDRIIREAQLLETKDVTLWWAPADSREQLLRDAELYNAAGARLAAEGLRFCYHNHAHEFRTTFNGVYALDILAEHTDPQAVHFRLDVAWITLGGADPAHILRKMAGRVPAIHLKDVYGTDEIGKWTALGTGVVDIRGSIEAAREIGAEWMTVEQDQLRHLSGLDTAWFSYMYLKESALI